MSAANFKIQIRIWWNWWIIRRIIIMEKIKEVWALAKAHPKIATAAVVVVIAIYFLVN